MIPEALHGHCSARTQWLFATAEQEARAIASAHIGTEHLLVAMVLDESGCCGTSLRSLGYSLEVARSSAKTARPARESPAEASPDELGYTPKSTIAFDAALETAGESGRRLVTSYDLLLGMLVDETNVASRILLAAGISSEVLRADLAKTCAEEEGAHEPD